MTCEVTSQEHGGNMEISAFICGVNSVTANKQVHVCVLPVVSTKQPYHQQTKQQADKTTM